MYSGFSKWLLRGVPWWLRFWVFTAMAGRGTEIPEAVQPRERKAY